MFQYFNQLVSGGISGQIIINGQVNSPYINTYAVNGIDANKINLFDDTGGFYGVNTQVLYSEFSPDKNYLACTTGNLVLFKRGPSSYNWLSSESHLGNYQCAWDSTGEYLVTGKATTPYFQVFRRSGDTFTLLSQPATIPSSPCFACDIFVDSGTINVMLGTQTQLFRYTISGNTVTHQTTTSPGFINKMKFSNNGTYLAVATNNTTERLILYKRTGTSFTTIAVPAGSGFSTVGLSVCWSNDDTYLVLGGGGATTPSPASPIRIYKRSGDTITFLTSLTNFPLLNAQGVSFNYDDSILAVAHDNSPYLSLYTRTGDTFTLLPTVAQPPTEDSYSVTFDFIP
jgi:WD40 repeat protein